MKRTRRYGDEATRRKNLPRSLAPLLPLFLLLVGCQSIRTRAVEADPLPAAGGRDAIASPDDEIRFPFVLKMVDGYLYIDRSGRSQDLFLKSLSRLPPSSPVPTIRGAIPSPTTELGDVVVLPYAFTPTNPRLAAVQPLTANLRRLNDWLTTNGYPEIAVTKPDNYTSNTESIESSLDRHVALRLKIDADRKLHVERGPAAPTLRQHGITPLLVRLENAMGLKGNLTVTSPKAGPVYGGGAVNALTRQGQLERRSLPENESHPKRLLDVDVHRDRNGPGMASGLELEYGLLLMNCHAAGKLDAALQFQFVPDGATAPTTTVEVAWPFDVQPAVKVKLRIHEADGTPSLARLEIVDAAGRVYPSMPKRLAPDFFFQRHIYRADGETISLAPGTYEVHYSRGPEYHAFHKQIVVPDAAESEAEFKLHRWVDPQKHGFYSGDHHIHGAGCSHYTSPTEGVSPADMLRQVKGEGLNVGAVLTWGPCYDFQRRYFSADADAVSEPFTLLKYDVEVSGFGSHKLGHVCLLNLRDQTYPGSNGTTEGWPTWTIPVLRWAKQQGGVVGTAHSASGMYIVPNAQAQRLMKQFDADGDDYLTTPEAKPALLPELFATLDANHDDRINLFELEESHRRATETLPNYAIPELNGPGAMEICVAAAHGVCDFISSMDTGRLQEWSIWYHLLNCGLPIATAGETDFPCMSGTRVGQGRTYVQLGKDLEQLNYADWCRGLAAGHSYVSDGYAHALDFAVNGKRYGATVELAAPTTVTVTAEVAFADETPPGIKHGLMPGRGLNRIGDTVTLEPETDAVPQYRDRRVELIVNGQVLEATPVPADGQTRTLSFHVPIERSSWIAIRQFPQLHTNPIRVLVAGKPIRASQRSAQWCVAVIEQLWKNRASAISDAERPAAEQAYEAAKQFYRRIAAEGRAARLQ